MTAPTPPTPLEQIAQTIYASFDFDDDAGYYAASLEAAGAVIALLANSGARVGEPSPAPTREEVAEVICVDAHGGNTGTGCTSSRRVVDALVERGWLSLADPEATS